MSFVGRYLKKCSRECHSRVRLKGVTHEWNSQLQIPPAGATEIPPGNAIRGGLIAEIPPANGAGCYFRVVKHLRNPLFSQAF